MRSAAIDADEMSATISSTAVNQVVRTSWYDGRCELKSIDSWERVNLLRCSLSQFASR